MSCWIRCRGRSELHRSAAAVPSPPPDSAYHGGDFATPPGSRTAQPPGDLIKHSPGQQSYCPGLCSVYEKSSGLQSGLPKEKERQFSTNWRSFHWSRIRDSNPPPTAWEAVALPDELTLQDCSISVAKCGGFVNSFFCRNAAGGKNLLFAPVAL